MRPGFGEGSSVKTSRRKTLGLLAAVPFVSAQTAIPADPPDQVRLLQNLLTRMGVGVRLNGSVQQVFVIDTGAERSAVSAELAQALALPPGRPVVVHGITAAEVTPTVELAQIEIGRRRFSELTLPVFPRDALGADGLLGLDLLSRFRLTLDVNARQVALSPSGSTSIALTTSPDSTRPQQQDVLVAGRRGRFGQLILTRIEVAEVEVAAFIDSGAQYSIGNLALMQAIDIGQAAAPVRACAHGRHRRRRGDGSHRHDARPAHCGTISGADPRCCSPTCMCFRSWIWSTSRPCCWAPIS